MVPRRFLLAALLAAPLVLLAVSGGAAAHASKTTADGKYRITWGFLDEPSFTHTKNRLDLIIRDAATGEGVGDIGREDLSVLLHYGEAHHELGDVLPYRGAKGATVGAGNYTSSEFVYLTRPGFYTLHIEGDIHGTPVDLEIRQEDETQALSAIMFPDEVALGGGGDTSALEQRIAALEAQVAALRADQTVQSTTPASLTPQATTPDAPVPGAGLLALLGTAVVAFALARRRA